MNPRRPAYRAFLLLILLLALTLTGCGRRPLPAPPAPATTINWQTATPQSLLRAMQESTQSLNTFTAYFQISMDPPPARMPSAFSGVLYLSTTGATTRLRIKAFHLFGTILFDMVSQDNTTQVYIPGKQTLYVGRTEESSQQQAQGPQQIFGSLMIDFKALHARPGSTLLINDDTVRLLLVDGEMLLDKQSGRILTLTEQDKTLTYSDYQQLAPDQPAMPTDIRLTTPQGTARCRLKEITLHAHLGPENFDISAYPVKETKALSEAGKH